MQRRIFAIVPAAGRSRRMGAPKQLLDVGGRPMLLEVLAPLRSCTLQGIVVVSHSAIAHALAPQSPDVQWILNDDADSHMIDSVRLGLAYWQRETAPADRDGFLVLPGDQPGVAAQDIERCLAAFRADGGVVVASIEGRAGHPLVFPAALATFVHGPDCADGLRAVKTARGYPMTQVACASPGVVRDIDTPDDYDAL